MSVKEPTQKVMAKDSEKAQSCLQIEVFKITELNKNIYGRTEVKFEEIVLPKNQQIVVKVGSSFLALKNAAMSEPCLVPINKAGQNIAQLYQVNKTKAHSLVSLTEHNRNQKILEPTPGSPSFAKKLQSDSPRLETVYHEMKILPEENKGKVVESLSVIKGEKLIPAVYRKGPQKRKYDGDKVPYIRENKIIKPGINNKNPPSVLTAPVQESLRKINHLQPIASDKAQLSHLPPRFQVEASLKESSILQSLRKSLPELLINGSHSKTASAISSSSRPLRFAKPHLSVLKPASRFLKMIPERDVMATPRSDPLHIFPDSPTLSHELTTQSHYTNAKTFSVPFNLSKCTTPNPIVNNKNVIEGKGLTEFLFEAIDGQKIVFSQIFSAANENDEDEKGSTSFYQEVAIQQERKDEKRLYESTSSIELYSSENRDNGSIFFSESETCGLYDSASSYFEVKPRMRRNLFTEESVNVLWNWFNTHKTNPYPNQEETTALAQNSGLSFQQVKRWFLKTRKQFSTGISSGPALNPQTVNVLKQWFNNNKKYLHPHENETIALDNQTGFSYRSKGGLGKGRNAHKMTIKIKEQ